MNTENLRKKVKTKMAEMDLLGYGKLRPLAKAIGVNYNQLSMALTGYRTDKRSSEILSKLNNHLRQLSKTA